MARRAGRRAGRRSGRRVTRRRMRRRIMVGGMVLLAVGGGALAIKMSKKDADKIEEHTGESVEELTDEELVAAMKDLGIQSIELDDDDKAAIAKETGQAPPPAAQPTAPAAAAAAPVEPQAPQATSEGSYLDELIQLADLRDQGIISEEDFEAKKSQLLGL